MENTTEHHVWRFGAFSVDTARRELRRDGSVIEVQPRVFDLLVYLLANHDRAVNKDELQDAVWPGMFITETALTRAVMKARKAVGDDATRQEFIKTIHGHGYRFVAALSPEQENREETPKEKPEENESPDAIFHEKTYPVSSLRRRLIFAGAVLAILAAILLAWAWLREPPPLDSETRIAVLPLADETEITGLAWTRLGLMSYVSNLLGSDGGLSTVADGSVISLADSVGWSGDLEDPANADLIARLRDVYGASHVLAMQMRTEGRALRMNFSLLGPDGRVQQGTMVGDQGTDLAQGVVQSVYGTLLGKRRHSAEVALVSADPFNNEAFARGMDLSLQGRCGEAVPFFRLIIEQEPTLFEPRFEYAACERILGEPGEAEAVLDVLIDEQRELGPGRPLARALMTRGVVYNRTGRLDLAEADHREALEIAESIGDQEISAKILQNLSIVVRDLGDYQQAEKLLDLAVLALQASGRESMPGDLYSAKANLRMYQRELVEARAFLEQALQAYRAEGNRLREAMMLNNMGYLLREMGRLEEAEDYHLRSLEIREDLDDRVGIGRTWGQLGALYTAQGRHREAAAAAQSAHEIAVETRDRLYEATSLAQWAAAEHGLGDLAAAREHYLQSRAVFDEIKDRMRVLQVDVMLARLDLEEHSLDSAETTALDTLAKARQDEYIQPEVEAMELLGEIAQARGKTAEAIAEYEAALDRVRESSWPGKEVDIIIRLANARLDAGDLEAAAPLAGALAGHEPTIASLKTRARFARAHGDSQQAITLLEEAKSVAGSAWDEQSEALLAEYRIP